MDHRHNRLIPCQMNKVEFDSDRKRAEFTLHALVFACPLLGLLFGSARFWFLGCQLLTILGFTHWLMNQGISFTSYRPNDRCKEFFSFSNNELNTYTSYAFGIVALTAWFFEGYLGDLAFAVASTLFLYCRILVGANLNNEMEKTQ